MVQPVSRPTTGLDRANPAAYSFRNPLEEPPLTLSPRLGLALLAACGLLACSDSGDGDGKPTLGDVIPAVATQGGVTAAKICEALPAEGAGPSITADAPLAVLPGGAGLYPVVGSASFDTFYVAVEGVDCFWRLQLTPGTSQTLVVSVGQSAPQTFNLVFGASSGGTAGAHEIVPVTLTNVGTGKVQVSVTWDKESDVDLHLVEPGGEEVYYANETSVAGGVLDLDSNAACSIDGVKNENITYTKDPPRGTYTVRLDYYDSCSVASTKYVVTVTVAGATSTFSGTFTGEGDGGGSGDGILITTFTY